MSDRIVMREELWQDMDGNPVPFGDVRGRSVLFGLGQLITEGQAKKYGVGADGRYHEPDATDEPIVPKAVEAKAIDSAPANKAVGKAPRTK